MSEQGIANVSMTRCCGKERAETGHEPDVHHIEPVRNFDDPQDAHTLDNVVCLCRSCHRYAEIGEISRSESQPKAEMDGCRNE